MKKKTTLNLFVFLCGFFVLQSCTKTVYNGLNFSDLNYKTSTLKVYSLLVDTRSAQDYQIGHINGAINIPFTENFLTDLEKHLTKNNAPNSLVLFMYASTAYITNNQVNEIKQNSKHQKIRKIHAVNYLIDDYTF